ncbi:putative methionyl-tRNA synthetase [Hordeum vulgare]|nr:putative methionyl-tRNA synthetase [Hordeum vulgare]
MANERPIFPPQHADPFPHDAWSSQQSVALPANFPSPNFPSLGWGYAPSSLDYADDDALGGFNPNTTFPRTPSAFTAGHNTQYGYYPTCSFSSTTGLHRGPLPFNAVFGAIVQQRQRRDGGDHQQRLSSRRFVPRVRYAIGNGGHRRRHGRGGARGRGCGGGGGGGRTDRVGADEEQGRKKKKWMVNGKSADPRIKWMAKEDECLAKAWKTVCMDSITGVNQNAKTYRRRIRRTFDERKLVDPEFACIRMKRGDKAMSNHWESIQEACNKWNGIREEVMARPESGTNVAQHMIRMFETFCRDSNTDADFKFIHVFTRIKSFEKWVEVRLALAKFEDDVYNPDAPISGVVEGWLDGTKKVKKARDSAPASERLQALIEQCIADAKSHSAMREKKSKAR